MTYLQRTFQSDFYRVQILERVVNEVTCHLIQCQLPFTDVYNF